MTTTNCFDEIIVRNRARRARDFGVALLLTLVTTFALGSIGTAGRTTATTPVVHTAGACSVATSAC